MRNGGVTTSSHEERKKNTNPNSRELECVLVIIKNAPADSGSSERTSYDFDWILMAGHN